MRIKYAAEECNRIATEHGFYNEPISEDGKVNQLAAALWITTGEDGFYNIDTTRAIADWTLEELNKVGYTIAPIVDKSKDPIWNLARLMLMVTELAEAAEDVRKDRWEHFGEELADVVIRVFDTAEAANIDIEAQIERKMKINEARPYKHGKNS